MNNRHKIGKLLWGALLVWITSLFPAQSVAQSFQSTKLTASDGAAGDLFGRHVAIHNRFAFIGAAGAAYVFEFGNGEWTELDKFTIDVTDLAISENVAVVVSGSEAHVYEFINGSWTETATLTASTGDGFESVSVSGDYVLMGAPSNHDNGLFAGTAYVFERVGDAWVEAARLSPSDNDWDDRFGKAVSLDGNRALIGAPGDDGLWVECGAAYVFERLNEAWVEVDKLKTECQEEFDWFGDAVSLNGDRALVGAYWYDVGPGWFYPDRGAAFVFEPDTDGHWQETAKLTASDEDNYDYFGKSLAQDTNHIAISAPGNDDGAGSTPVYIYKLQDGIWMETTKLVLADGASDDNFDVVALYENQMIVGAYGDDERGDNAGAAYIFDLNLSIPGLIEDLQAQIDDLYAAGFIERRQHDMLTARLKQALSATEKESYDRALQSMAEFVGLVDRMVYSRQISTEEAQPLYDAAHEIIDLLKAETGGAMAGLSPRITPDNLTLDPPEDVALYPNHPNPFNPTTVISFALPEQSEIRLTVYDMLGREVARLVDGTRAAGNYEVSFDAGSLPSGMYLYRLETPELSFVKRMVLLK